MVLVTLKNEEVVMAVEVIDEEDAVVRGGPAKLAGHAGLSDDGL